MKPFSQWTEADVALHNSRVRKENMIPVAESGCEVESELHGQILDECRRRGWIALHGSMASPTKRTEGECDFCCLLPGGVVIFVECKTRKGKLSPEQNAMRAWMQKLGHEMQVVRSFAEFLQLSSGALTARTLSASGSENSSFSRSFRAVTASGDGDAAVTAARSMMLPGCDYEADSCPAEGQGAGREPLTDCRNAAGPMSDGNQ